VIRFRQPVDLGGYPVGSVGEPTQSDQAANKAYVDGVLGAFTPGAPLPVQIFGAWSTASVVDLSGTAQSVKATPGTFGGYMVFNDNAAASFVQIWDAEQGDVTVGTTPADYVLSIPAGSAANLELTCGVEHAVAITVAATTTPGGAAAPATGLVCAFFYR